MKYKHLTREQRYAIYLGRQKGETLTQIAQTIGVSKSTVSRELRRNLSSSGKWIWTFAHDKAESRKRRTPGNRAISDLLRWRVVQLIKEEQWSPAQISGALAKEGIKISHETIYKIIRADETGELSENCRHKMKYKRHGRKKHTTKATNIKNRVSIHERPKEANGTRFGDWEMDLIVDKYGHALLTLTERSTNFIIIVKLKNGKNAMGVAKAVWRALLPYKGKGLLTITTDNGSEFARHEWITKMLGVPVYFADSYCSWQKGAIENGNKLIRQYIPKGTDISTVSESKIAKIQKKINRRPRKKLNFATPTTTFYTNFK